MSSLRETPSINDMKPNRNDEIRASSTAPFFPHVEAALNLDWVGFIATFHPFRFEGDLHTLRSQLGGSSWSRKFET